MKFADYELLVNVCVEVSGSVSDFGRGMDIGSIQGIIHAARFDKDLNKEDLNKRVELKEKACETVYAKCKEAKERYESKSI